LTRIRRYREPPLGIPRICRFTVSNFRSIGEPEPQVEEASKYGVIANWLSRIGIQAYRIRVSGHYYPYQLKTILGTIKPKKNRSHSHRETSSSS